MEPLNAYELVRGKLYTLCYGENTAPMKDYCENGDVVLASSTMCMDEKRHITNCAVVLRTGFVLLGLRDSFKYMPYNHT